MSSRLLVMLLPVLLALPAGLVHAREDAAAGFMAADEEMVQKLLRVRTREELVTELDTARKRKSSAESDLAEMEGLVSIVTSRVAVKRQEISLLKERVRIAKKESDTAQVTQLENQRRQEEKQLGVFEAMRDAAVGQVDRARAARDFAVARIDLQELELNLVDERESRVARAAQPTEPQDPKRQEALATLDLQIHESSRKVLASIRDYARRSERLAKTTETLAKENLRLLDLWEEYSAK